MSSSPPVSLLQSLSLVPRCAALLLLSIWHMKTTLNECFGRLSSASHLFHLPLSHGCNFIWIYCSVSILCCSFSASSDAANIFIFSGIVVCALTWQIELMFDWLKSVLSLWDLLQMVQESDFVLFWWDVLWAALLKSVLSGRFILTYMRWTDFLSRWFADVTSRIIDTTTSNLTQPDSLPEPGGLWVFDFGSGSIWAPAGRKNFRKRKEFGPRCWCCFQHLQP